MISLNLPKKRKLKGNEWTLKKKTKPIYEVFTLFWILILCHGVWFWLGLRIFLELGLDQKLKRNIWMMNKKTRKIWIRKWRMVWRTYLSWIIIYFNKVPTTHRKTFRNPCTVNKNNIFILTINFSNQLLQCPLHLQIIFFKSERKW